MTGEPECQHDVCITCSDTAVAVTVVRLLDDGLAVVDTGQGEEEVSVALVRPAAVRRLAGRRGACGRDPQNPFAER